MTYRFHHLHLICQDLEKMIGFFTGALGAALVVRKKFGPSDGATLDLQGTTVNLRVPREGEPTETAGPRSVLGYDHIGLTVGDVDAAYADLSAKGFEFITPPTDIPEVRIAFFKGPEDIVIELMQPRT
jgi:catechol 2,3-dioxygenase-like lactoylglutathione lyase family enzyme